MKPSTRPKVVRLPQKRSRVWAYVFWLSVFTGVWFFGAWTGHSVATNESNHYWDLHMSEAHHEH